MAQIEAIAKDIAEVQIQNMRNEMSRLKPTSWRYKDLDAAVAWLNNYVEGVKAPCPNLAAKVAAQRITKGI